MLELKICRRYGMKCEMCGKEYTRSGNNQRFCRGCAALRKKNSDREYRETARIRRRLQPGENRRHIIEATAKARAAGMSYGQYIAGMRESDG